MNHGIARVRRKLGFGALAAVTAIATLILPAAAPSGAAAGFSCQRLAGNDRYETAVDIATKTFPAGSETVLLATGEQFPDALAGNFLAGNRNAPILLTARAALTPVTKTALGTLKAKNVIILGGVEAVSAAVASEISGTTSTATGGGTIAVTRIGGANRYETARLIATATGTTPGTLGGVRAAIVARGDQFPDALAGGAVAFANKLPILLTEGAPSTTLNSNARTALQTLSIQAAWILGGTQAITTEVENAVRTANTPNLTVTRLGGANRGETARLIAEESIKAAPGAGFSTTHVNLARGDQFPDALTGGPHAGTDKAPILLTESSTVLGTGATTYATAHAATLTSCHIFGGVAAIQEAVANAFITAAGGTPSQPQASVTNRPELQSASIVQTNATQGTTVKYCFDEVITSTLNQANFHVWTSGGDGSAAANAAFVDATDTKCANVTFPTITSSTAANALTVATVDIGAVTGLLGTPADQNPEGDAPLGTTGTTPLAAGVTSAPDLTNVSNFRADPTAPSTNTLVDFTFDETAYRTTTATAGGSNGYRLVQQAGNAAADTACTYVSGDGSATHTVTCPNPVTGAFSSTNVIRGYVEAGEVTDAASGAVPNGNVLQAHPVAAGGNSDTPDLVSCTLQSNAKSLVNTTADIDRVIFTFDEPVVVTGPNTAFQIYTSAASTIAGQATGGNFTGPTRSTANDTQVAVEFSNGTLDNAVGCSVLAGAVAEATNASATNRPDEEGVTGTGTGQTAGRTAGPDLIGVTVTSIKDPFGTITGYSGAFKFDEDVDPATSASVRLWLADGTQLNCAVVPTVGTTEETDDTVTCSSWGGATLTQLASAVLGTVDNGVVNEQDDAGPPLVVNSLTNPEGAQAVTQAG